MTMAVLREPLVIFVAAAMLLFAVHEVLNPSADADPLSDRIVVDRTALRDFARRRANAPGLDIRGRELGELSSLERDALVDDYVREEVLYREASRMGLDGSDYIMRRRLVQKLMFMLEHTAEAERAAARPSRAELERFYETYRADYVEPATYTFAQIFFDAGRRGAAGARAAAEAALRELHASETPFDAASSYGDRPLYFRVYADRTRAFVATHLGEGLADAVEALEPSAASWAGPFRSPHGWHLVLLTQRAPERLPALDEIRARVAEDYTYTETARAARRAIERVVAGFDVDVRFAAPD